MDTNDLVKKFVSAVILTVVSCTGFLFSRVSDLEAKANVNDFALTQILKKVDRIEKKIDFIYRNLKD